MARKLVRKANAVPRKKAEAPKSVAKSPVPAVQHDEIVATLEGVVRDLETTGHRDDPMVVAAREVITRNAK